MTHSVGYEIDELEANLRVYPFEGGSEIDFLVIGDLHANPMKALWILIHYGVIKLKDPYEHWKELWSIYLTPVDEVNISSLERFLEILMETTVDREAVAEILFLGDMIADRGENDIYMFMVLSVLHQDKVPYNILMSNHDWEAIVHFDNPKNYEDALTKMPPEISRSMLNRRILEDKFPLMRDFSRGLYLKYYQPNLKLYAYSRPGSDVNILYSHAPILSELIEMQSIKFLRQEPEHFSDIVELVDKLNRYLLHHLTSSRIFEWSNLIWDTVWNRNYTKKSVDFLKRMNCLNVHGHDMPSKTQDCFLSLDSMIGKPKIDRGPLLLLQLPAPMMEESLSEKSLGLTQHSFLSEADASSSLATDKDSDCPEDNPSRPSEK